jgi:glycosyltransferase involved in cell wall biosynthesis
MSSTDLPSSSAVASLLVPTAVPPLAARQDTRRETVRVLHVINGEHYAGAERVQDLLAQRLPEFGYSAGLACVKPVSFDEMRRARDVPLYNVPMRTRFDLRAARKIARIVEEHDYRIVHSHTVRSAMVGGMAAALAGVPMVYHAHSPTSRNTTGGWLDRINAMVEQLSLRRVARVIAVSHAMAEHIARGGFDARRIAVVPNGVPQLPGLGPRRRPRGVWTLGTVALFRPRKGTEILLEAIALLRRQGTAVRLRAIGAFESLNYQAEIGACLQRLALSGDVTWTGFTRDVTTELLKMDLLVLPSLFGEGLPMVVLEAMAAGVPVVATRVAGVPEAIRHGQDGVLADPGDAEQLARAIADVIEGRCDWSEMRRSAHERHAEHFSDRAMAAGVAAVYNELLCR